MILFKDIFDEVVSAMRAKNNPDEKARATRKLNEDYMSLAAKESWAEMRTILEITWTGDAVQLPSDLLGIDLVWDDDHKIEFLPRNRAASEHEDAAFRYFTYPVSSSLVEVGDGAISQDGTVLSSPALLASGETIVGEYFYTEDSVQLYKVTEVTDDLYTFTPAYRGQGNVSGKKIIVRPSTTKMLDIEGPYDGTLPTGTFKLHYWKQPELLRDPEDIVLLPTSDVLILKTLGHMSEARKNRPVSQTQVDAAFQEAAALNPDRPVPRVSKGINGRAINFNNRHYASRDRLGGTINRVEYTWQQNRR